MKKGPVFWLTVCKTIGLRHGSTENGGPENGGPKDERTENAGPENAGLEKQNRKMED